MEPDPELSEIDETNRPLEVARTIARAIKAYDHCDFKDSNLWEAYLDDFEGFTENDFKLVHYTETRRLRTLLRKRGVWIEKGRKITVAKSLFNTLQEEHPTPWTEDEIKRCLDDEEFTSYAIQRLLETDFGRNPKIYTVYTPRDSTPQATTFGSGPAPASTPSTALRPGISAFTPLSNFEPGLGLGQGPGFSSALPPGHNSAFPLGPTSALRPESTSALPPLIFNSETKDAGGFITSFETSNKVVMTPSATLSAEPSPNKPPDYIQHDASKNFVSKESRQFASAVAVTTRTVPVEAHCSIGIVERYHAVPCRAYKVIMEDLSGTGVNKEVGLQMVIKAERYGNAIVTMGRTGLTRMGIG